MKHQGNMMNILKLILFCLFISNSLYSSHITVKIFTGEDVKQFESMIVQQRQYEFSKFPYLMWNGNEYEEFYAALYTQHGAVAIAYENETVVGFLTGCSLEAVDTSVAEFGFIKISDQLENIDVKEYYYFGEVIVFEPYRGKRIADMLFTPLEQHAQQLGFSTASFITIIRQDNDPRKPIEYKGPTNVWHRLGYTKSGKVITYDWPTYQINGALEVQKNSCEIWIKQLAPIN